MVISLAQVVAAIAVGAMIPIAGLLAVEMHRLRHRSGAADQVVDPPIPERVVDDDRIEAIAQLAAARFETHIEKQEGSGATEDCMRARSKAHLTLLRPARPARKRSLSSPAAEARRPATHRPAAEPATRTPGRVTRD